jgi:benzoyl-CoA reductase/2-hydroxyglutaryl-CoA dehydratase subunit BcrC/BadD/HgdB
MADLLVAETTCDGKKKMYELLAEERPMHVLEYPQKPSDPDAFEHWVRELQKLRAALEAKTGVTITNDRLRDAIREMNRERSLKRRLAMLMKSDAPPITGRQLLDMKSVISCLAADFEQYEAALDAYEGTEGDPAMADRVRVLMTGVPMAHGAERVIDIVEDNGGLVVAMESCTGWKPIATDIPADGADPIRDIARKYLDMPCSVQTPNHGRFELLRALAAEYRAECVIDLIWQACITYDVESTKVKRLAEEELDLPFLRIETDYTPSDTARIAVRVEALFETARARAAGRK